MSTENTEAASAPSTSAFTQETPSSTVENIPQQQDNPDFATWLSDRLDNFQKGEETPPWEVEDKKEAKPEGEVEPAESPEDTAEANDDSAAEAESEPEAPEAEEEDTKNMSTSAGARFKELKGEVKKYKTRVEELERALNDSGSTPQNPAEVEELRSRLAEYEQEIAVSRVEASPDYKRAVLEPTQQILDAASTLAERYKVDARKLVGALREESSTENSDALTEIAGDFSERDRVRLYRMADDLADVAQRREYLRVNASRALEEMTQKQAQAENEHIQQTKAQMAASVDETWDGLFKDKQFVQGMDPKVLDEARQFARQTDYFAAPPEDRAYAVYSGLLLPHVVAKLEATESKAAQLEKALSKYKKASPKVSGNTDTAPAVTSDGGFLDAMEQRFANG